MKSSTVRSLVIQEPPMLSFRTAKSVLLGFIHSGFVPPVMWERVEMSPIDRGFWIESCSGGGISRRWLRRQIRFHFGWEVSGWEVHYRTIVFDLLGEEIVHGSDYQEVKDHASNTRWRVVTAYVERGAFLFLYTKPRWRCGMVGGILVSRGNQKAIWHGPSTQSVECLVNRRMLSESWRSRDERSRKAKCRGNRAKF